MPYFMLNAMLRFISFLSYTLNLDLTALGIPNDPFGSMMITNVGSLGLEFAYVPLVPYSRVPILLAIGAVKEQPVVENGQVTVRKIMRVNATFDHRFIDGFHAASMSRILREWIEHPYEHFDKL
jgi:pyruvate dehydrogenase E2 component (dihydrolipoamide acetyltransferase)